MGKHTIHCFRHATCHSCVFNAACAVACKLMCGIISNAKLKNLVSKGPKYREPVNISWQEARTQIDIGRNEYIGELSSNKGINACNFREWKNKIISSVNDDKTNNLKIEIIPRKVKSALNNCDSIANLKELHIILFCAN